MHHLQPLLCVQGDLVLMLTLQLFTVAFLISLGELVSLNLLFQGSTCSTREPWFAQGTRASFERNSELKCVICAACEWVKYHPRRNHFPAVILLFFRNLHYVSLSKCQTTTSPDSSAIFQERLGRPLHYLSKESE